MTTVTETTTFEYDDLGRLVREITTTVTWTAPPAPVVTPAPYPNFGNPGIYTPTTGPNYGHPAIRFSLAKRVSDA